MLHACALTVFAPPRSRPAGVALDLRGAAREGGSAPSTPGHPPDTPRASPGTPSGHPPSKPQHPPGQPLPGAPRASPGTAWAPAEHRRAAPGHAPSTPQHLCSAAVPAEVEWGAGTAARAGGAPAVVAEPKLPERGCPGMEGAHAGSQVLGESGRGLPGAGVPGALAAAQPQPGAGGGLAGPKLGMGFMNRETGSTSPSVES